MRNTRRRTGLASLDAPNIYGLSLKHKHLPEMQKVAGLKARPGLFPILGDIYQGMATSVLLHNRLLRGNPTAEDLCDMLSSYYEGQKLVSVAPFGGTTPRLSANALAGSDRLRDHGMRPRGADDADRPASTISARAPPAPPCRT